jgi:hypothetical protein
MTDTTAANKLYGSGSNTVKAIETATDVNIEEIGLLQHAIKQSNSSEQPPEKSRAELAKEKKKKK